MKFKIISESSNISSNIRNIVKEEVNRTLKEMYPTFAAHATDFVAKKAADEKLAAKDDEAKKPAAKKPAAKKRAKKPAAKKRAKKTRAGKKHVPFSQRNTKSGYTRPKWSDDPEKDYGAYKDFMTQESPNLDAMELYGEYDTLASFFGHLYRKTVEKIKGMSDRRSSSTYDRAIDKFVADAEAMWATELSATKRRFQSMTHLERHGPIDWERVMDMAWGKKGARRGLGY